MLNLAIAFIKPVWTSGAVSQMSYWFTAQQQWKHGGGGETTAQWILKDKKIRLCQDSLKCQVVSLFLG